MKLKEQKINIKNSSDKQNTSSSPNKIKSTNTFNETTSANIRWFMRNELAPKSWLLYTYKTIHNMLASLQNETQCRRVVPFARLQKSHHSIMLQKIYLSWNFLSIIYW